MTNHPTPIDLLAAYVDDALEPATRAAISAHLETCAQCRADVEEQRQVKRFLMPGSPLAPPVPAGLAERVRAAVLSPPATLPPRPLPRPGFRLAVPRAWLAAGALAAVLVLAVLGLDVLQLGPFAPSAAAQATDLALQDHAMCEHMGGVGGPQRTVPQAQAQLGTVLQMPIAAPTLIPSGFHFDGGHAVALSTTHGAHLAWMADSNMLSVYQAPDPGGAPPAGWQEVQMDGTSYWIGMSGPYRAVFWRVRGMMYLVCGTLPQGMLLDVAHSVS